ncbi:MAG: signal peptidase I, partial [Candidatus Bathyarchaeia archaeon]
YYGAQAALGTPYPALAVASDSMFPTLNIGDLIIVQKIDPAQINADLNGLTGDILVYRKPIYGGGEELVVHRAVKVENRSDGIYITTRSDKYGTNDTPWHSSRLVGKVIARIPFIGHLPLLFHSQENIYILLLAFLVILIILIMPLDFGGETKSTKNTLEKTTEKRKLFKINLNHVFYVIINIILIGLVIFGLWGQYTFWQPGAGTNREGRWVTIYGMYADVQFHENESFGEAKLSQNFLTYKIDCKLSTGTRLGVPTFAWYQFFIIIVVLYNAWKIYGFWKEWKAGKRTLATTAEAESSPSEKCI